MDKELFAHIIELRKEISRLRWMIYSHIDQKEWSPGEIYEYREEIFIFEKETKALEEILNG